MRCGIVFNYVKSQMKLSRDEKVIMGLFSGLLILLYKFTLGLVFSLVGLRFQFLLSLANAFIKLPYHLFRVGVEVFKQAIKFISLVVLFFVDAISYISKCDIFKPSTQKNFEDTSDSLCCVYLGTDTDSGMSYVGQTSRFSEARYLQHRKHKSGPFKNGAKNVNWSILKQNIPETDLNYWESYYIGLYNSFSKGFNANRGNDLKGYNKGIKKK